MKNQWTQLLSNLVFVDLETTGLSNKKDRVIEFAAVTIRGNKVVDKHQQLINPGFEIDKFTTEFTGIKKKDLEGQPSFADVAPELISILNRGGVFVAHNAPFDYGFLESEFNRVDIPFVAPRICTVELSRALYPGEQSHGLDAISSRFNIKIRDRHRALDDALATWYFFQKVNDIFEDYPLDLAYQRVFQPAPSKRVSPISKVQMSLLG